MTAILKQLWSRLNKILTFVNVLLFGLLTFTVTTEELKKAQKKKVPLLANMLLLLFFGLALFAVISR